MMNITSRWSTFAAAVLLLALFSFSIVIPSTMAAVPQNPVNFSLRSVNGPPVTSAGVKGHPVVFALGATWLPLSRTQLQGLKQLSDDFGPKGVLVYWVSTDSDSPKSKNYATDEQVRAFAAKYGVTVLRDPDLSVMKQFGVNQLPAVVILDKNGAISGTPIEGLDPNRSLADQVAPRLNQLLGNH
jgi:alkyl hydroperoxide reductase subunit AhpC